ncbi:uncharacterized protein BDZ99DRAFT_576261 [Mytilinidion resinicola]|uniref:Uncharacterized protein n=1 Tax=Mytilinidion resinicola TaxID=574789 RepID=A0A6A6Y3G7_9PEZI|nr:uncharacterized protein BDZ99DRAFT_576261 [Mytilinidion resinicola]KAF2803376.1 hypothetical protein BDZ99DRAFT_576261 [Mytilinidion resinicola]
MGSIDDNGLRSKSSKSNGPGLEDQKSNTSPLSLIGDHQPLGHEKSMSDSLEYNDETNEVYPGDEDDARHDAFNASSGRKSPSSSFDSSTDQRQRITKTAALQPTVDSDHEDMEPEPSVSRDSPPNADQSRDSYVEHSEGKGDERSGLAVRSASPISDPSQALDGTRVSKDKTQSTQATLGSETQPLDPANPDLEQVIKKGFEALKALALKGNADEVETEVQQRVEEEMARQDEVRRRIAVEQAEKLLLFERQEAQKEPLKWHKYHVEIDTLVWYDVPFEYDMYDHNYITILQQLDEKQKNILFEHTRRLRARRLQAKAPSKKTLAEEQNKTKVSEYAHVRRPKTRGKPVGHQRTDRYDNSVGTKPLPDTKRWVTGRKNTDKKASATNDARDASPPPAIRELNINLQVPPFLAWPSELEEDKESWDSVTQTPPRVENDGALIQLTLSVIEEHIHKNGGDDAGLPATSQHPFLTPYRLGEVFVEIPEKAINDLEFEFQGNSAPLDIRAELAFLQKGRGGTSSESKPKATHLPKRSAIGKTKSNPIPIS